MVIRSTHIRIPNSSRLYVFGSALIGAACPQDLDVLVIYNERSCKPEDTYQFHAQMILDLESSFGLRVHPTYLTQSEEAGTEFIVRTGAIEFDIVFQRANHSLQARRP